MFFTKMGYKLNNPSATNLLKMAENIWMIVDRLYTLHVYIIWNGMECVNVNLKMVQLYETVELSIHRPHIESC